MLIHILQHKSFLSVYADVCDMFLSDFISTSVIFPALTVMIRNECLQIGSIYDELDQLVATAFQCLQLRQRTQIQYLHFVLAHLQLGKVL